MSNFSESLHRILVHLFIYLWLVFILIFTNIDLAANTSIFIRIISLVECTLASNLIKERLGLKMFSCFSLIKDPEKLITSQLKDW